MNNLLVGNGINIQFNKTDYTTQQIVLRILKNCDRDDFPSHIIVNFPYLLKNYIGQLFLEARDILEDKYDNFTNCTAEDESLKSFKKQYADKIDPVPDSTMIMTDLPMTTPESTGVCIAKSFFRSMHQKNGRTDSYSGKLSSP